MHDAPLLYERRVETTFNVQSDYKLKTHKRKKIKKKNNLNFLFCCTLVRYVYAKPLPPTHKETTPYFSFPSPPNSSLLFSLLSCRSWDYKDLRQTGRNSKTGSRRAWDRNGARESMNVHVNSWTVVS